MAKPRVCTTKGCTNTPSKGAARCASCYRNRGRKPPKVLMGECGHQVSRWGGKLCKACFDARGRNPDPTYPATVCGHPVPKATTKYCRACFNGRRDAITQQGLTAGPPAGSSFSAAGDAAEVVTSTPENVRTLAELVRVCQIDTTEWIVERWVANKWEMGSKDAKGKVTTTPLYQIKAWLKRNRPIMDATAEIEALLADAKAKVPARPAVTRQPAGDYLLEIAIPDLHIGKLAWAPETGYADYDTKIAERLYDEALDTLIARTSAFQFDRIVLPVGNDLIHSDSLSGATTKGTPLDNDSRYPKTFTIARKMITRAIDRLRALAPVSVVMVSGNHDQLGVWHLGHSLECYFHATAGVTIDNAPTLRKYLQFGQVAIMWTHGDRGKAVDWPLLFATERPEMFGTSRFREIHTGHQHQTRLTEKMGVRVRISPALCSPDAWHSEQQFVGNLRGAEAFVWSKTEGLVNVAHYTVPETL